jgi:hypothetical protein
LDAALKRSNRATSFPLGAFSTASTQSGLAVKKGGAAQQRVSGARGEMQKSTARRTHNAQGVADF